MRCTTVFSYKQAAASAPVRRDVRAFNAGKPLSDGQVANVRRDTADPTYTACSTYLRTIGFTQPAEVARVLDIATNPNSLFISYSDPKRARNASARPLDVDQDMRPVVEFLISKGLSLGDVQKVIVGHPPVLSYSVTQRLEPLWNYLEGMGLEDVATTLRERPSLFGLDVDNNLRKIVDYLQYVNTPPEQILKYLQTSI